MTHHMCDVEGYRATVDNAMNVGLPRFYVFYQEKPDFRRGLEVFKTQFLPFVEKYVKDREVSLDIGYGPGSMVFAAAQYFKWATGVDVIRQNKEVAMELRRNSCDNFQLYVGNGTCLPLEDEAVDFAHSWTVFMHFGKVEVVKSYLAECYRVMRKGGVAVLYFARMNRQKPNETKEEWEESIAAEPELYREKERKVNQINLTISMGWMEVEAWKAGFEILERTASTVEIHGIEYYHGQHGLVLRK